MVRKSEEIAVFGLDPVRVAAIHYFCHCPHCLTGSERPSRGRLYLELCNEEFSGRAPRDVRTDT